MRNAFADAFHEIGKANPKLAIVVADISPAGSIQKFREEFPERFINTGVAEQAMIGICAGMALRGMRPFAYTIATFSLFRPFEMVRDDLCYQDLPVTVVGMGSGVVYATLGGTHLTQEDIAVASAVPNMQVIAPCDPLEVGAATRFCALDSSHPTYLRIGKAGEPVLTKDAEEPWIFGKIRYLRKGEDVCILACGGIMSMAFDVAHRLEAAGATVSLVSVHTVKPIDRDGIARALALHRRVAVIEEHVPHGGLGSRVKEIAWDTGAGCDLKCFSLKDEFIHQYGGHEQLLAAHGLEAGAIATALQA
jgi:transketolase